MLFESILFEDADREPWGTPQAPPFFADLNLDQLVDSITAGFEEYELKPFYYTRLTDLDLIHYRQEVIQDLDDKTVMQAVESFSHRMRRMRTFLTQSKQFQHYKHAMARRFLAAVGTYCEAVQRLNDDLTAGAIRSRGIRGFQLYLAAYITSGAFQGIVSEVDRLARDLSGVTYSLLLNGGSVTVRNYTGEPDYTVAVEETFAKFRRDRAMRHEVEAPRWSGMNHIEAQVQDRVALLFPDVFNSLEVFYNKRQDYLDQTVTRFDREVQFYVAYLTHVANLRRIGLTFCLPQVSETSKEVAAFHTFDLALAGKLLKEKKRVVTNDFFLCGPERILVVSGPNQGGKTTFARTFGQLHYLASLGCPVPGEEARLFLFDQLFTHFERAEDPRNLRGKLQDDLIRIRGIVDHATSSSIIVMNEIFSSTTVKDAIYLGKKIVARISAMDSLAVCVTFLDELASFNEKTVSMVSTVDPNNPAQRTYKIERRPADGLAYALAIAEKYRVTYNWIQERVQT
jgi:DNA mismatch repair protein MutS